MRTCEKTIEKVLKERGNDWLSAVIDYHVNQGYGQAKGLSGLQGYIKCFEERQIREITILKTTGLNAMFLSESITKEDFANLFQSAGWNCPTMDQIQTALQNTTKLSII